MLLLILPLVCRLRVSIMRHLEGHYILLRVHNPLDLRARARTRAAFRLDTSGVRCHDSRDEHDRGTVGNIGAERRALTSGSSRAPQNRESSIRPRRIFLVETDLELTESADWFLAVGREQEAASLICRNAVNITRGA